MHSTDPDVVAAAHALRKAVIGASQPFTKHAVAQIVYLRADWQSALLICNA